MPSSWKVILASMLCEFFHVCGRISSYSIGDPRSVRTRMSCFPVSEFWLMGQCCTLFSNLPSWELTYPILKVLLKMIFPIPQVGYVNSLVGSLVLQSFFEFGIIVDRFVNELIGLEITKRQAPDKVPKSRGILVILGVWRSYNWNDMCSSHLFCLFVSGVLCWWTSEFVQIVFKFVCNMWKWRPGFLFWVFGVCIEAGFEHWLINLLNCNVIRKHRYCWWKKSCTTCHLGWKELCK